MYRNRERTQQSNPLKRVMRTRGVGIDVNLAEDVVTDALVWNDASDLVAPLTNWVQVTGTSIAVTLRITHTNAAVAVIYYVNTTASTTGAVTGGIATTGTDLVVAPLRWIAFSGTVATPPGSTTITVRNFTNGNKQIDTVTLSIIDEA